MVGLPLIEASDLVPGVVISRGLQLHGWLIVSVEKSTPNQVNVMLMKFGEWGYSGNKIRFSTIINSQADYYLWYRILPIKIYTRFPKPPSKNQNKLP